KIDTNASLTIGSGGTVTHNGVDALGTLSDVEGSFTLTDGALVTLNGSLTDNGYLEIDDGSELDLNGFKLGANGTLFLKGVLRAVTGVIDLSEGTFLDPGTLIGTIDFGGAYDNTGSLELDGSILDDVTNDGSLIVQGSVGNVTNNGF